MLDYKVRRLADLMRLSKKTILYIDATTTTNEGFDSKKAITYCEVKQVKPIFTHPGFLFRTLLKQLACQDLLYLPTSKKM